MNWIDKLQGRWKVKNAFQVIMILIVFALTGFTVVFLKKPLMNYFFEGQERPLWASILYYLLILPIYNLFLLFYGFVLGQFSFFWAFEKRFLNRIFGNNKKTKP